ncbi:MAG: hypothetical protein IJ465_01365 [Clostridia bacterium]|nr:hypothetical protein [Clostridia bacterium]
MKKILAMAMVLVLAFSLCTISVAAEADGSAENPWEVNTPMQMPWTVTVAAGDTQWYAFNSNFFDGMTFQADYGLSEIVVDGMSSYPSPALQGGIEFSLTATSLNPILVGFVNNGEEEVTVNLSEAVAEVFGTQELPVELYEGDNTVILNEDALNQTMGLFYTSFYPTFTAEFTFTVTNILEGATDIGFENLYVVNAMDDSLIASGNDADGDGIVTVVTELESYSPIFVVVEYPFFPLPELNINIAGPVEGSAERPIEAYGEWGIEAPFTVPAGESLYVNLCYLDGVTLYAEGDVEVKIGEEVVGEDGIVLEGEIVSAVLVNNGAEDADVQLSVVYPEGTEQNPMDVWLGDTEVELEEGEGYAYFEFTANVDGTLTITPADSTLLGNIRLENTSTDDYEKKYAEMSPWGFDEDFNYVQTLGTEVSMEVSEGDVIYITVENARDENDEFSTALSTSINVDLPQPEGSIYNPGVAVDGDNALSVPAGSNAEGYYMLYTATADGKLTVTFGTLDKLDGIAIADYEMNNSVEQVGTEITDGVLTMDVKKGEKYWIALLPASADALDTTVDVDLEVPAADDDKDDDKKEEDKTEDKPASPVTGPITGAGIALVVAAASGAYVFLNKKR